MTRTLNVKALVALTLALIMLAGVLMIPVESFAATGTIKASSAKLRDKPSSSSSVKTLATLKKGASVEILKTTGSYYQVRYGTKTGYVKTSEVTVGSSSATSSTAIGRIGKIEIPNLVRNKKTVVHDVVCAKDNKYYLDKNPDGKKDVNGSIFMDFRNQDPKRRRNLILYGHNMKDGSMFAALHYYGNTDGPTKYSKIYFTFTGTKYEYEPVIIGMVNTKESNNYLRTQFSSNDDFVSFIKQDMSEVKDMVVSSKEVYKAWTKSGYTPSSSDEILTLSTCVPRTIKNYANFKWIVVCRRVGTVK